MFSSTWGFCYTLKEEPCQWAPTNAKLWWVRRGTWFSSKARTAVSEAAGGALVPHSVLHGGTSLSLAQICHSQLLGEAHIFPFLKISKWGMKFLFSNPACGRGGRSRGWSLPLFMAIHWSEHLPLVQKLWLCSLPNLLRINPVPCVRHQKRARESSGQKEQIREQK